MITYQIVKDNKYVQFYNAGLSSVWFFFWEYETYSLDKLIKQCWDFGNFMSVSIPTDETEMFESLSISRDELLDLGLIQEKVPTN